MHDHGFSAERHVLVDRHVSAGESRGVYGKIEIERDGASFYATIDELITYLGLEEFTQAIMDILG